VLKACCEWSGESRTEGTSYALAKPVKAYLINDVECNVVN